MLTQCLLTHPGRKVTGSVTISVVKVENVNALGSIENRIAQHTGTKPTISVHVYTYNIIIIQSFTCTCSYMPVHVQYMHCTLYMYLLYVN